MTKIIPSLASADQYNLEKEISKLKTYPLLHLDIEDGNFIPNITFGLKTVKAVAENTDKILDVHLMVTNPELYIDSLLELGVKGIAIHAEASLYPGEYLEKIRKGGAASGLAVNFKAGPDEILPYKDKLDYVLVMTSEPDGRGQEFNPYTLKKINELRVALPPNIDIMADGGINASNMKEVIKAGANILVMGREVWSAPDPEKRLAELAEI